ncbi:hypothetical protein HYALB_00004896 [Hymenoscyphus albidus]|uniref:D-isomer specific 2-hydroxyacid dehydrogenase NAD-binding domain-containing protein n=1 Tax=Hymenoscyphus albidus TaxID=595503 RepID=A0A9N9Q249_9HELO|nr:hypothetical protein HYALB_00004896 [Hymenoscyphus albidus]
MNTKLEGHKVVILLWYDSPPAFIPHLQAKHPGLQILWHNCNTTKVLPEGTWKDTTALLTWDIIPELEEVPKLQLVQLTSSGANHCFGKGIYEKEDVVFCTSNGTHPPQIAEWVFATFLSFQHRIPRYMEAMREEKWTPTQIPAPEDSVGLRIGVLGYGAIGRQCANVAKAFGMDIIVFTMRPRLTPESRIDDSYVVPGTGDPNGLLPSKWYHGTTSESLNHFLAQDIDLLLISLPLTPSTTGLIAKEQFHILKKKRTFVSNIGRGPIIKTDDFIEALEEGWIRGAAVDVTDQEPLPKGHKLWKAKNLFISPHVSWRSTKHAARLLGVLETNLERLSKGEAYVNRVDKVRGF